MRLIRLCFFLLVFAVVPLPSASAFSLLGPYAPWMTTSNGFGSDIGGPMDIGQGYRWNVPLITYAYDQSFLNFFGTNGVAAVEEAIQILNSLPPASILNPTNYSMTNGQPLFYLLGDYNPLFLIDLKSAALGLLLEQMGLACPEEYAFCLHDYSISNGVTNYDIITRNFDPLTLAPSPYINGDLYTNSIYPILGVGWGVNAVQVFPGAANYTALGIGHFGVVNDTLTNLTYDDAGGLRYLLSTNNLALENLIPGVQGAGANAGNYVTTALRPGVDKITFQRVDFDPLLGVLSPPLTNTYVDSYVTNGTVRQQNLQRVITQPDIVFSASSLNGGFFNASYNVTGTSNWVNNGLPGSAGPGIIQPPINISFACLGPGILNLNGDNPPSELNPTTLWGSFDAFLGTNTPPFYYSYATNVVVYPTTPPPVDFTTFYLQMLVYQGYVNQGVNSYTFNQFSWNLPGPLGNQYVIQSSSNLSDWITITNFTNFGRTFTYTDFTASNTAMRFYRTIPQ